VSLRLLYLAFCTIAGRLTLLTETHSVKELKILVLRHENPILRRHNPKPRMDWTDRTVLAALVRLPPRDFADSRWCEPRRSWRIVD
jgi:putative transposase